IYDNPAYYEVAFSFFDVKKQIDAFEAITGRFSRLRAERFLDIACGPSLQLRELARRGHTAIGLDSSPEMLQYLVDRAKEEGLRIETLQADMCAFSLRRKVDFAFIMMGSLVADSDARLLSHLDSVAGALKRGGLYFIQNRTVDWTHMREQKWTAERAGITVRATFGTRWKDVMNQTYTQRLVLDINDHGRRIRLESEEDLKFVFPQEFKTLIALNNRFEFLGWWEGTDSTWFLNRPLDKARTPSNFNMVLLRRR
ncbi:MAG TPA: class I SAM-dependent methyltransferase, partial [Nitrososphaerales archaeon]|nr:class I SAM-dependent methyltransferase [Nitrososphaerales archaeon]